MIAWPREKTGLSKSHPNGVGVNQDFENYMVFIIGILRSEIPLGEGRGDENQKTPSLNLKSRSESSERGCVGLSSEVKSRAQVTPCAVTGLRRPSSVWKSSLVELDK